MDPGLLLKGGCLMLVLASWVLAALRSSAVTRPGRSAHPLASPRPSSLRPYRPTLYPSVFDLADPGHSDPAALRVSREGPNRGRSSQREKGACLDILYELMILHLLIECPLIACQRFELICPSF